MEEVRILFGRCHMDLKMHWTANISYQVTKPSVSCTIFKVSESSMLKLLSLPNFPKFWQECLKGKVMLDVFFGWQGIMHHDYIP
jgi:hypothetical protein